MYKVFMEEFSETNVLLFLIVEMKHGISLAIVSL